VLAPALAGHAGGPPLPGTIDDDTLLGAVERAMDEAGFQTAHLVGNSLGGYLALRLAARGRAESVVALAPAGGWATGDVGEQESLAHFYRVLDAVPAAVPYVDQLVSTRQGRRLVTEFICENFDHIPAELLVHQLLGIVACEGARRLAAYGEASGWPLPDEAPDCPVRVIWGTEDRILTWPGAAARHRDGWLKDADWVVLDGVGHCPQLDVPAETVELILEFTGRGR